VVRVALAASTPGVPPVPAGFASPGVISAGTGSTSAAGSGAATTAATGGGLSAATVALAAGGAAAVAGGVALAAENRDEPAASPTPQPSPTQATPQPTPIEPPLADGLHAWDMDVRGTTQGCLRTPPDGPSYGAYVARFALQVDHKAGSIQGGGTSKDADADHPSTISGSILGSEVRFRRYGPGWTPGYTVDWNYAGALSGRRIAGSFSGGGDPKDSRGDGCLTAGTFTVTIR